MKRLDTNQGNKRGPYKQLREDIDVCPVCGKKRGGGVLFVDHGACVEKQAAASAKSDSLRIKRSKKHAAKNMEYFLRNL
jgi:hypothetical protein